MRARRLSVSPAQRGFTLVEILVVVVIVAVLALAVTVAVGGAAQRRLAREAERFSALVDHACTQAELTGREIGVRVSRDGYAFLRLDPDGWRAIGTDGPLRARGWPPGIGVALSRDGRELELASADGAAPPQLACFSSGEATPFELRLSLADGTAWGVRGREDATSSAQPVEDDR